jgi:hypothetical protein
MDLGLGRKDFQVIVGLATVDLALTIYGITSGQGAEMSPLYRPFTERGFVWMLAGAGLYLGIIEAVNVTVSGTVRSVLAAVAAGMHLVGLTTWITGLWLPVAGLSWSTAYIYMVYVSLATAVFYAVFERKSWRY